jgi:hypothetical protein
VYVNEKRRSVETVPGLGGRGIKNDEESEFNYDTL